jgi:hypothetical protein
MTVSFNFVSQTAHVGWGYIFVTAPAMMFGPKVLWWTLLICVIGEAVKEIWDSRGLETKEVAGNSYEDFAFWCVGNGAGVICIELARYLSHLR